MTAATIPSSSGTATWTIFIAMNLQALARLSALGTWQAKGWQWKEALIDSIEARTAAPPSTISDVEQRGLRHQSDVFGARIGENNSPKDVGP